MDLSFATRHDTEAVRHLWEVCFKDETHYMDTFFFRMYKPENTCVARDNGKVISSLQMFPHTLCVKEKKFNSMYIGGVDTLPAYRGRGIATDLIAFAEEQMKKQHIDIAFLVPVSSTFYYKMGYRPLSFLSEFSGPLSALSSFSEHFEAGETPAVPPILAYESFARRFPLFLERDISRFSNEIIPLSESECYVLPDMTGYILYTAQDNTFMGWECAYSDETALRKLLAFVYKKYGYMAQFRIRVPADGTARSVLYDSTVIETRRLHAMAKSLSPVALPQCMENYINMIGWF